jgi:hypothetical protein
MPEGGAVQVRGNTLVDVPMPALPDAGVSALEKPPVIPAGIFSPAAAQGRKPKPPVFFAKQRN